VHAVAPTGFDAWTTSYSVVVGARLLDPASGEVLARHADFPQPLRFIEAYNPGLKVVVKDDTVEISAEKPVKGLVLSLKGDGKDEKEVVWSDNGMDVMPGDAQVVTGKGLGGREVEVVYLGKEKASPAM
jgi:beta-mannosidase